MLKKLILTVCFTFIVSVCYAMPFTVDERSAMHATAGLVLGYPVGIAMAHAQKYNDISDTQAVLIAGTIAIAPLVGKEFLRDGHPDAGDLLFDMTAYLGAYLGLKTGQHFFLSKKDDTAVLNYIVRY